MTQEMELTKQILCKKDATCVIYKDGKSALSNERGVSPLILWLEEEEKPLAGAHVADKVIGKAAALLMIYAGVREVYAGVISEPAARCFEAYQIPYCFGQMTARIANRAGTGLCPMEELCMEIDDPKRAYQALKNKLQGKQ